MISSKDISLITLKNILEFKQASCFFSLLSETSPKVSERSSRLNLFLLFFKAFALMETRSSIWGQSLQIFLYFSSDILEKNFLRKNDGWLAPLPKLRMCLIFLRLILSSSKVSMLVRLEPLSKLLLYAKSPSCWSSTVKVVKGLISILNQILQYKSQYLKLIIQIKVLKNELHIKNKLLSLSMRKHNFLNFDVLEVLEVFSACAVLNCVQNTEKIALIVEQEVSFVHFRRVRLVLVSDEGLRLRPRPPIGVEFTIFDKLCKLRIVLLHVSRQVLKLIVMDDQKGRHEDDLLDLTIVVPIVEEFVKAIACFLRFRDKKEMMAYLLPRRFFELLNRQFRQFLDVRVVNDQIVKIHDEEIDDFVVFEIVPAHLIESKLGLKDVIAKIENDEAVIDELYGIVI